MENSRDVELTSVWENDDDFPRVADREDPTITHVWLSTPRLPISELQAQVTKEIERVLYQHARRRKYPSYWLTIYANLSLEAYKLPSDYVARVVRDALIRKPASPNVERVWVWNMRLDRAFPAQES